MHDPHTQAFRINWPKKDKHGFGKPFITIWHKDPEKDGTDDSCGWFIRQRHLPQDLIEKVRKDFVFEFDHNYWFNEGGYPKFSTIGVVICMYSKAAWNIFMWKHGNRPTEAANRQYKKFMRKYLYDIILFAENPTDSLHASVNMKYGVEKKEERINHFVSVIVSDIMRKLQPWYKHPRWHIYHWRIQLHPWQNLRRRYFLKCCICGKRGFKSAPMSDWGGTKHWHQECDKVTQKSANS